MIRRLLSLNGLAVLGVILNHSAGWGYIAMFWWTHRYLPVTTPNFDQLGSLSYYALRVIEQLIIFSIPAFLFVSGFFIAVATGRTRKTVGWKLIGTRIRNLVIPYLFWSAVIFIGDALQGTRHSAGTYLTLILSGQTTAAYYFVPLLCQLYVLSPIIVRLAKRRWKLLLLLSGFLQLSVQTLRYPYLLGVEAPVLDQIVALTPGWFFPGKAFWFVSGVVAGFHLEELKLVLARVKWKLLGVAGLLFPLGVLEWEAIRRLSGQDWVAPYETALDSLYAGAFILCFVAFERASIPFSRRIGELGGKSFGVYLTHSHVLIFFSRVIYHVAPWILAHQVLFQPTLIVAGLAIPLLLMTAVNRSPADGLYHYLFG